MDYFALSDSASRSDPIRYDPLRAFVFLDAWDGVIYGWGYIHGVTSYQKSITLLF